MGMSVVDTQDFCAAGGLRPRALTLTQVCRELAGAYGLRAVPSLSTALLMLVYTLVDNWDEHVRLTNSANILCPAPAFSRLSQDDGFSSTT